MSLFCKNCGRDLSQFGQVSFCPGCGEKIDQGQQAPSPAAGQSQAPYTPPTTVPQWTPPPAAPQWTPPPTYTPPTYAPSPAYPPQMGAKPKGGLGTGAIIALVAGGLAVVALIVIAVLLLGRQKPYDGSPAKLSGNWDAVMRVNLLKGSSLSDEDEEKILGKDLEMTLRLTLDKSGRGTADLVSDDDDVGDLRDLKALYKDGKLTLTGLDDAFSFEGTVGERGLTLSGKFTIEDEGNSASGTIKAEWDSKGEEDQEASAEKAAVEETKKPAQDEAKPTPDTPAPTKTPDEEEPDSFTLGEYIVGEWIGEELGDGMSMVFVFNKDGTCVSLATMREGTSMTGWKTGDWYVEFQEKGTYTLDNETLTVDLDADWQEVPSVYEITVIDEGTMDFKEEYGDGSFTMTMTRIG